MPSLSLRYLSHAMRDYSIPDFLADAFLWRAKADPPTRTPVTATATPVEVEVAGVAASSTSSCLA